VWLIFGLAARDHGHTCEGSSQNRWMDVLSASHFRFNGDKQVV
jgi:hypothetical protein